MSKILRSSFNAMQRAAPVAGRDWRRLDGDRETEEREEGGRGVKFLVSYHSLVFYNQ